MRVGFYKGRYSIELKEINDSADSTLLGVKLGRICIKTKTPVAFVTNICKVSRATVYNWFTGRYSPTIKHRAVVAELIEKLEDVIDITTQK